MARIWVSCFGLFTLTFLGVFYVFPFNSHQREAPPPLTVSKIRGLYAGLDHLPGRTEHLANMQQHTYDVLVIGGGATGAGVCVEAASRGLKIACIEAEDFAGQTSGKSTKLVHGGVRYLEQCMAQFDMKMCSLVYEALSEREIFMNMAPHLSEEIRILIPVYKAWQGPYFLTGLRLYDWIAAIGLWLSDKENSFASTQIISSEDALKYWPHLKSDNLYGAVVYSDGSFRDTRMAVSLMVTAAQYGASIANYVRAEEFIYKDGQVAGAKVLERKGGRVFDVRARVVVNATGPQSDELREADDPEAKHLIVQSSGSHIVVPNKTGTTFGLLLPTVPALHGKHYGSVAFIKPYGEGLLVGTTDQKEPFTKHPKPTDEEIDYLLGAINSTLSPAHQIAKSEVMASWKGFRPLVLDAEKKDSRELSRNHQVLVSRAGLISIVGGKWTTFRKMAQDVVDHIAGLPHFAEQTVPPSQDLEIIGKAGYSPFLPERLANDYRIDLDIAHHLVQNYGGATVKILDDGYAARRLGRLIPNHPYTYAEVDYVRRYEMALTIADVVHRRLAVALSDMKTSHLLADMLRLEPQNIKPASSPTLKPSMLLRTSLSW